MQFKNQILLGDCRYILKNFDKNSISACITDPPYNYEFIGKDWDAQEVQRRLSNVKESKTLVKNIPYGSGLAGGVRNERWYERNRENIINYEEWCLEGSRELFRVVKPGAPVVVFNSSRTLAHVQVALEASGFYARDIIVYRRSSGIPKGYNAEKQLKRKGFDKFNDWKGWHSCLRSEWEGIVVVQKPLSNNYTENIEKYGLGLFNTEYEASGFQSNIIENISRDTREDFNVHCTVKPLELMEKLISIFVPIGDDHIILDPFAGSGSTLVAAKNLGRNYIGIEMIEDYLKIIKRRLEE